MPAKTSRVVLPSAIWVVACAFLTCTGWILSLLHQLNTLGYVVALLCGATAAVIWWIRCGRPGLAGFGAGRCRHRFRRGWPCAFMILAVLTFLGGALQAPTNYDALAYRVPRILNWLAEGQWHWVHTEFQRLNVRATGIEWISAPLIALSHSDRFLFLINTCSFVLLPGLVFSVFTRLGLKPRAVWHWMWLLPTGYCFLLQAGSIGNDMFSAVFALAALDFALRAKDFGRVTDVWLCCLAAALLTGGKTSNFPLLLPVAVALLPSLPLVAKRFVPTAAICLVAAGASFLPTAALNVKYCGDWSGNRAEQATFRSSGSALYVAQNALLLLEQNFVPPVFPISSAWNRFVVKIIPDGYLKKVEAGFEPSGAHLAVEDMAVEENAGLGFGVSVALLLAFVGTQFSKRANNLARPATSLPLYRVAILAAAVVSFLPYMAVSGSSTPARLLTPYYCLVVPIFLLRQSGDWIRRNAWWRWTGWAVILIAFGMVVISPARPLWPAQTVLSKLGAGGSHLVKRAESVYAVYSQRPRAFEPLLQALPADFSGTLGLIAFDEPETSLWKPFGARRIVHLLAADTAADARSRGIKYVLASGRYFATHSNTTLQQWLDANHMELVQKISLTLRASEGPSEWLITRVPDAEAKNP